MTSYTLVQRCCGWTDAVIRRFMCSHYQAIKARERYYRKFGVYPPPHEYAEDMWPRYQGTFIRRPRETAAVDPGAPSRQAEAGCWGLVPWNRRDAINADRHS